MISSYKKKISKHTKTKKDIRVDEALIYILCSKNNIRIDVTDLNGNTLCWCTSGSSHFKGRQKTTPLSAKTVAKKTGEKMKAYSIKSVEVRLQGFVKATEEIIQVLSNFVKISSLVEVTPIAFNGTRPKKRRVV